MRCASSIDAANVLARRGEQQPCEDVLTATRAVYKHFLTDMKSGGTPMAETPDWRERQIRAAVSVSGANVAFRSDELLGVEVRSPNNLALGSVDDLVLSPQTGKIAYLVIARGGIFGFDESHVPVPWDDFKATPNASLLVLDTTKSALDGAPQVKEDAFSVGGDVDAESQKGRRVLEGAPTGKSQQLTVGGLGIRGIPQLRRANRPLGMT